MKKALILLCAIGSLTLSGTAFAQHRGGGHGGGGHFSGGGHFGGGHHSTFVFGSSFYGFGYGSPYYYGYGYPYSYGYGYPYGYGYGAPYGYGGYGTVSNGRVVQQQQRRLSTEAAVQSALASEGYYRGRIDGVIGTGSRSAIRAYQRQNGLPSTGRIDNSLLESLGI